MSNPADEQAWDIFFQKLETSLKGKIWSLEEWERIIQQKSNPNSGNSLDSWDRSAVKLEIK